MDLYRFFPRRIAAAFSGSMLLMKIPVDNSNPAGVVTRGMIFGMPVMVVMPLAVERSFMDKNIDVGIIHFCLQFLQNILHQPGGIANRARSSFIEVRLMPFRHDADFKRKLPA